MADEAKLVKRRKFNQLALQNFKAVAQTTRLGERRDVCGNSIWQRAGRDVGGVPIGTRRRRNFKRQGGGRFLRDGALAGNATRKT